MESILIRSEVKKLFKQHGRQLTKETWTILNGFVTEKIEKACSIHNGGRSRVDAAVLAHVGVTSYRQPSN